jgi:hypothetical protein
VSKITQTETSNLPLALRTNNLLVQTKLRCHMHRVRLTQICIEGCGGTAKWRTLPETFVVTP